MSVLKQITFCTLFAVAASITFCVPKTLVFVASKGKIVNEIELRDTAEYCADFLSGFDSYVIKCDTQGMDALILSRIPQRIWENVECAVIEVWALPEINELDVEKLLSMWEGFKYVSWEPNSKKTITLDEINQFWLKKSGKELGNLFLSKSKAIG